MITPDDDPTPPPADAPVATPVRKLRESVALPPPNDDARRALQSTGHLPVGEYRYQMSDVLALAIHSGASDLHLRVGEPPVYRVDGRLIRAEGPPVSSDEAFNLIRAFTTDASIQVARDVGQVDFGV